MPTRALRHPGNSSLVAAVGGERLSLYEIVPVTTSIEYASSATRQGSGGRRKMESRGSRPLAGLTCVDWNKDPTAQKTMAFGNNKGEVYILNWDRNAEVFT